MTKRDLIIGTTLALTAALSYGIKDVLIRQGVTGLASPLVGATVALLSGTVLLGLNAARGGNSPGNRKKGILFFLIAGIIGGFSVASNYFALSQAPVVMVNPIVNTSPLFALLWSSLFLRQFERITPRVILGGVLVVVGAVLIVIGRQA